jgi:organic hydroperoxide reductase OsmC/OhrA
MFYYGVIGFFRRCRLYRGRTLDPSVVDLEQVDGNWTITAVHLNLTGRVPGIDAAKFEEIADQAKAGCPVSRVLKADITLTKKLES